MVLVPVPAPLAKPLLLMVATDVLEEVQPTERVRTCVLPSLKVPVAVNCCVVPLAIDGFAGVTTIDDSTAVTVNVVEPMTGPKAARMVLVSVVTLVSRPALLMVATLVL